MALADLNVRLGLIYKDLDRGLRNVERSLQRSGRRLSSLGNDLTLAISAPLAALGGSAIQQAGNLESLRLAMKSTFETAGRSASEAEAEVEKLRQAALAPGLDFEQAIKGSIRLQGVGYAAEQARDTIAQVANAVALTGGTAENLDSVTVQFSQMIAKGKVLTQDLRIIQENMPIISRLMQQAFGTQNAEALQKLGISGKEFVDRITAAAKELPRVEGGIKNAIVNAGAAARQSLAQLGEEINKAFNVTGLLDRFASSLQGVVDWFKELDDGTKRAIISTGAFLIALGPAVKVFGTLSKLIGENVALMRVLIKATKTTVLFFAGMTESTKGLTGYVKEFATTMLGAGQAAYKMRIAFIAATGGLAAILLGIAAAVTIFADKFDAAAFTQEKFKDAKEQTIKAVAKETGELNKNFDILKNVNTGTEDRKKAIKDLLTAYPTYLQGLDLEKLSVSELTKLQKKLNDQILRGVAERQKASAVNSIYEKQAEILLRIQQIQRTGKITAGEATLIDTGDLIRNGSLAAAVVEKLQAQVNDLGVQADTTAKDFDKAFGLQSKAIDRSIEDQYKLREAYYQNREAVEETFNYDELKKKPLPPHPDLVEAAKKKAELYKDALASIAAVAQKGDVLGGDVISEQAKEIENQLERLLENGFKPNSREVQHLKGLLVGLRAEAGKGFLNLNETQQALGFLDRISATIGEIAQKANFNLVQIQPGVSLQEINLPSIKIPKQVVQIDTTPAQDSLNKVLEKLRDFSRITPNVVSAASQQGQVYKDLATDAITATGALEQLAKIAEEGSAKAVQNAQLFAGVITGLGDAIATTIEEGVTTFRTFATTAVAAIGEIIKALIKQYVAQLLVNSAFAAKNPLVAIALGAAAASIGAALFKRIVGGATLAEGGVVTKPTLALIGEYPGAGSNPEIVTPENKLRSIFNQSNGGMNNELVSKVAGDSLLFIVQKATRKQGRIR